MPKYKNRFKSPEYHEETIVNEQDDMVGTIRVKPSSVLWKPRNKQRFLSVPLDKFIEWITDPQTKARETKS